MKAIAVYSELAFKTEKGDKMYRTYFYISSEIVAWVYTNKMYTYGEEIVLTGGRDSKTGRAVLKQVRQ